MGKKLKEERKARKKAESRFVQIEKQCSTLDFTKQYRGKEGQIHELEDLLEGEQYFSILYKTQVKELKKQIEERNRI
ncbi:hypothetical protein MC885_005598 [Smutsia gigantea]|nr:hypothetical protein MC885_005598 [Smutsia gigantea]